MASVVVFGDLAFNYGLFGSGSDSVLLKIGYLLIAPSQKLFRLTVGWNPSSKLNHVVFLVIYSVTGLFVIDVLGCLIVGLSALINQETHESIQEAREYFFKSKQRYNASEQKLLEFEQDPFSQEIVKLAKKDSLDLDRDEVLRNANTLIPKLDTLKSRDPMPYFLDSFKELLRLSDSDSIKSIACLTHYLYEFAKCDFGQMMIDEECFLFRNLIGKKNVKYNELFLKSLKLEEDIKKILEGHGYFDEAEDYNFEIPLKASSDPSIDNDYAMLEVDASVSNLEIKRAYMRAAIKYHPDKNANSNKFPAIKEAYERIMKKRSS